MSRQPNSGPKQPDSGSETAPAEGDSASTVPIYLLGIGLVLALVLASVALAADGTVLDSETTIETMDESGVYSEMTAEIRTEMVETIEGEMTEEERQFIDDAERQQIAERVITESYVRGEISRNIEQIYAYLHGDRDAVTLAIDQREPRSIAVAEIQAREPPARTDGDSLAVRVEQQIDDQQYLTENGEAPEELDDAREVVGILGTFTWLMPVLALGSVGGIYHFAGRSVRRTAWYSGIGFLVAGIVGLALGYLGGGTVTSAVESAAGADGAEANAMIDGVVALVENFFGALTTYAWIITVLGAGAVGAVYADRNGYFDDFRSDQDGHQQAQYQQQGNGQYTQQYQQEPHGHPQQGHQGQQRRQGGQYQQDGYAQYEQSRGQQTEYQRGQEQQRQGRPQGYSHEQDQQPQEQYQGDSTGPEHPTGEPDSGEYHNQASTEVENGQTDNEQPQRDA